MEIAWRCTGRSGITPAPERRGLRPRNLDTISTESPSTVASLVGLADCQPAVSLSCPDLPPIDVRRAYFAWCAPSPWLIALVLASTSGWMLASPRPVPPLLAGFGAAALVWFRSDGPGHASRAGVPVSLGLIGLAVWAAALPTASTATLQGLLALAAALVVILLALRLHAVVGMARRLQARVEATPMASRWSKLPASVSALMVQQLHGAGAVEPSLQRTLVLATLAWAANEEAQAMEQRR
ncbi:hypothetical protein [Stenotrophomonas sp. 59]|uniref:hypothetical protein n=1 Tax=Stenotrophomonas sp. 59 TaxID=3051120 RepID=UPI00256F1DAF|nr:hypothetical protein [Stenotrophomonas sp. 59]